MCRFQSAPAGSERSDIGDLPAEIGRADCRSARPVWIIPTETCRRTVVQKRPLQKRAEIQIPALQIRPPQSGDCRRFSIFHQDLGTKRSAITTGFLSQAHPLGICSNPFSRLKSRGTYRIDKPSKHQPGLRPAPLHAKKRTWVGNKSSSDQRSPQVSHFLDNFHAAILTTFFTLLKMTPV